jgi:transposase
MLGHDARLMPAKYVRPYSKGQKNDFRDAEAITEAVQRPTMKFVATKTTEQLDLQALHRVRERLVSQRTGLINQIRAFLLERGIAVRQGLRFLRAELPRILATPCDVWQHIETRQLLSARPVRPGGLGGVGQGRAKALGALWPQVVDRSGAEATASQRSRHRARQQARPHCLERPGSWPNLRGQQDLGRVIIQRE